jgi:large subunit ribosomal protein L14e
VQYLYENDDERESEVRRMSIYNVGRVCIKLAGRDAGKKCVVVNVVDEAFVLVDGETRRRKVNIRHLEPMDQIVDVADNATTDVVAKALGIEIKPTKAKKAAERPRKQRKGKVKAEAKPVKEKKVKAKAEKKEKPVAEN